MGQRSRALIFLAGERVSPKRWQPLLPGSLCIAADAGIKVLSQMQVVPDVLLGDFDSLPQKELAAAFGMVPELYTYSCEKDQTDGELAVAYALEHGASEVVLVGGWGGRPDHALANVLLLARLKEKGATGFLLNEESKMFLVGSILRLQGNPDQIFSLLPLSLCQGVDIEGGYYPLIKASLRPGETRGLSNRFLRKEVTVKKEKGLLVAILLDREEERGEG
ncbi:MAG: thiamine diphosphokinase [bacterium]